jgi:hypothetical protein
MINIHLSAERLNGQGPVVGSKCMMRDNDLFKQQAIVLFYSF